MPVLAKSLRALRFAGILCALFVSACGYHLRGVVALPFDRLYLDTGGSRTLAVDLERTIRAGSNVRFTDQPDKAQATLQVFGESNEKRILALSGSGRVREFQLVYRLSFRLYDRQGRELIAPNALELIRDFPFNDAEILAREHEESVLYQDMRRDAVQQIMWRLSSVKL
ncbi:MAG: LPS assembly lipoprotein LptE [Burkholderiales bacterium]